MKAGGGWGLPSPPLPPSQASGPSPLPAPHVEGGPCSEAAVLFSGDPGLRSQQLAVHAVVPAQGSAAWESAGHALSSAGACVLVQAPGPPPASGGGERRGCQVGGEGRGQGEAGLERVCEAGICRGTQEEPGSTPHGPSAAVWPSAAPALRAPLRLSG